MRHSMFGAAKAYSRARVSYRFAGRVHVVCGAAFLTRVLCGASGGAPSIKVVLVGGVGPIRRAGARGAAYIPWVD